MYYFMQNPLIFKKQSLKNFINYYYENNLILKHHFVLTNLNQNYL